MNNSFAHIDNNRIATSKQVYGVACHFASLASETPSQRYGLTKVFNAVLNKFYGDQDIKMTHGEVSDFRGYEEVPEKFLIMIKKPAKPQAKPRKAKAKKAEVEPEVQEYIKRTAKPVKPTASVKVNSTAKKLDTRLEALESKIGFIETALAALLEAQNINVK